MTTSPLINWNKQVGTTTNDMVTSVAIGFDGTIYVGGYTEGTIDGKNNSGFAGGIGNQTNIGLSDAFILKFYGNGTQLWSTQIGSNSWDSAKAISIGSDGAVYIAGDANGSVDGQTYLGSSDVFIAKYTSSGLKLWTKQIGTSSTDKVTGIATDPDGSLYITGYTEGSIDGKTNSGFSDAFLMKVSSNGTQLWSTQIGSNSWDSAKAISIGSDGAVYIAGDANGSVDGQTYFGNSDGFLMKFSSNGNKVWTQQIGTKSDDKINALFAEKNGQIYIGGETLGSLYGPINNVNNNNYSDGFIVQLEEFVTSTPIATGFIYTSTSKPDKVIGTSGKDFYQAYSNFSNYTINKIGSNSFQIQSKSNITNSDTINSIERIEFGDISVALDVNGSAGQVAKVLGAVFGASYVSNYTFVGIGLAYLDGGMSYKDLCGLAAAAAGLSNPDALVTTLLTNVSGTEPTNQTKASYINSVSNGTSYAQIVQQIADSFINSENIKLTNIENSGLGYIPFFLTPTYSISALSSTVNEGSNAVFKLTTTNVAAGTEVLYTLSGVNVADLITGSLSGKATIGSDGVANINIAISADSLTESTETLIVSAQGVFASTAINDTSKSASQATYKLTTSTPWINEGDLARVFLSTTNVPVGTKLQYSISGAGIDSNDIVGDLTGFVSVDSSGLAQINTATVTDYTTEGLETIYFTLGEASVYVFINDTSIKLIGVPPSDGGGGGDGGGSGSGSGSGD